MFIKTTLSLLLASCLLLMKFKYEFCNVLCLKKTFLFQNSHFKFKQVTTPVHVSWVQTTTKATKGVNCRKRSLLREIKTNQDLLTMEILISSTELQTHTPQTETKTFKTLGLILNNNHDQEVRILDLTSFPINKNNKLQLSTLKYPK